MRAFITGATGFAGSHLVDQLLNEGHEIVALVHGASSHQQLPADPLIQTIPGDLLQLPSLKEIIRSAKPDVIYHLAGQASPAISWQDPAWTMAVNVGGTANVLESALAYGRPRVVVVTSAEIYGPLATEMLPLTEKIAPKPQHPYGISKQAAGQLVEIYWQRYQLPVIEARPFNHVGPRQTPGFVVPDFASQLAAIKLGMQEPVISVGNLDSRRDFTDVRDVAGAYRALAQRGQAGEAYLICSGKPTPIQAMLDMLVELAGVQVQVFKDPQRQRPSDTPIIYGSFAKIKRDAGWQPQIPLQNSLSDALEDWLERLRGSSP